MQNPAIGIFGKTVKTEYNSDFTRLISELNRRGATVYFYKPFAQLCVEQNLINTQVSTFSSAAELKQNCNLLISLGGDGTLLHAVSLIGDSKIPVAGLNFGKLGFLAPVDTQVLEEVLQDLCLGNYDVEQRSLLHILSQDSIAVPFALNDITFKSGVFGTFNVEVWIDGHFLNTYFGDGLIIATPTGSTAYNLSCGGPILLPENQNFILTPIASHTLTVRPLVIPDTAKIEIRIPNSTSQIHTSLDSQHLTFCGEQKFLIRKAPFSIHTIRLRNQHFFDTIRNKLMWGQHARREG